MSPRSIEGSIPRCTVLVATLLLSLSLTPIIVECGITWNSPCLRATCTSNVPLIDVCTGDPINPKIFKSACYAYCNNQVRWRRCDGDIADDDDADATAPTIETRCLGKSLEGSDAEQECRCRSNCHTCSYTVGGAAGIPGSCELCKNGKYLLNNECVDRDACTATPTPTSSLTHAYTPKGTGNFGKRCELVATSAPPSPRAPPSPPSSPPRAALPSVPTTAMETTTTLSISSTTPTTTTTAILECTGGILYGDPEFDGRFCNCKANCYSCQHVFTAKGTRQAGQCLICKNGKHLLDGDCVESEACSDASLPERGKGRFGLKCGTGTTAGCTAGVGDCNKCSSATNLADSRCTTCKNSKVLHDGYCHADCPDGFFFVAGQGPLNRQCEPVPNPACSPKVFDCHRCNEERLECTVCYHGKYLHHGECIDSCPQATTVGRGTGNFNRRCTPVKPCVTPDCHTCTPDGLACAVCRNRQLLSNGYCLPSCPDGATEVGGGADASPPLFGRTCCAKSPEGKLVCG